MGLKIQPTRRIGSKITTLIAVFALVFQPVSGFVASQVANAVSGTDVELQKAVDSAAPGSTVTLTGNVVLAKQLSINKTITIDGAGSYSITANFTRTGNDNDSVIGVYGVANTATLNNLVIDAGGSSRDLHGIDPYVSNVIVNDSTIRNARRAAINANGSEVTINNLITSGNRASTWSYGTIDLAKGDGVTREPKLTINGQSIHNDNGTTHIRRLAGTVVDNNEQYSNAFNIWYTLKSAPTAPSFISPTPAQNSTITNSRNVTISWNKPTYATTFEYTLDGGATVKSTNSVQSFTQVFANGEHVVQVRSVAASGLKGNWNTARTFTVNVYDYNEADSNFIYTEKYIKANNDSIISSIAGQVKVPAPATAVRFTVKDLNGSTVASNIPGVEHIQTGQWPHPTTGAKQFKFTQALPAGEYIVTAQYQVNGAWHDIVTNSPQKLFVLGQDPVLNVVNPNDGRKFFRAGDSDIVKVRVSDPGKVFSDVRFQINGATYTVSRDQCDLRQAGNYVLCDVTKAANWPQLAEGNYTATVTAYDKARNNTTKTTPEFTIDNTTPVVTDFTVTPTVVAKKVTVSAKATDNNGVKSVKFYVTARDTDGTCKNNLPALTDLAGRTKVVTDHTGNVYKAELDTSGLNGNYCVLVSAQDVAVHNSVPQFKAIEVDNTAPKILSADFKEIRTYSGVNYTGSALNGKKLEVTFTTNEPLKLQAGAGSLGSQVSLRVPDISNAAPSTGWTSIELVDSGANKYIAHINLVNRTNTSSIPVSEANPLEIFKDKTFAGINLYFQLTDTLGNNKNTYYAIDPDTNKPIDGWTTNNGDVRNYKFTLDNKKPELAVVNPDSKKLLSSNDSITIEATDDSGIREIHANIRKVGNDGKVINDVVGGFELKWNPSNIQEKVYHEVKLGELQKGTDIISLSTGKYELRFSGLDIAGNNSGHTNHYFTVNNEAPKAEISVSGLSAGNLTNNKNIEITGTGTPADPYGTPINTHFFELVRPDGTTKAIYNFKNLAGHICVVNDNKCSFKLSDYYNGDGEYKIRYVVTDKQGIRNDGFKQPWAKGTAPATFSFIVDTTKPVISGPTNTDGVTVYNPTSAEITATDENGSGIKSIVGNVYKKDDAGKFVLFKSHTATSSPLNITADFFAGLKDGEYYLKYNAHDNTGNISKTVFYYFIIDRTPPKITINESGNTSTLIQGTVDSDATEVWVKIGTDEKKATINNEDGTWSLAVSPALAVGTHNITARAVDAVGNTNTADTNPIWATSSIRITAPITETPGDDSAQAQTTFPPVSQPNLLANLAPTPFIPADSTGATDTDDNGAVAGARTNNNDDDSERGQVLAAEDAKDSWSLINLLLTIGIGAASIISLLGLLGSSRKDRKLASRLLSIVPAAGAVVALLLIEDFSGSIIWVNAWSLLIGALAVIQMIILGMSKPTTNE